MWELSPRPALHTGDLSFDNMYSVEKLSYASTFNHLILTPFYLTFWTLRLLEKRNLGKHQVALCLKAINTTMKIDDVYFGKNVFQAI